MLVSPSSKPARCNASFFERLFDGAGLAIFASDLSGQITARNELAERLCMDRNLGGVTNVHELFSGDDAKNFEQALHELVTMREPLEFRAALEMPEGRRVEYAVWLAPLFDAGGTLEGVTTWFHDITDRMQLRRSMRKTERLTTLGSFSGAIAHHYNNSLACIIASLEYAQQLNTVPMMKKAVGRSIEAATRASNLTHQLLAFAQGDYRTSDQSDLTEAVLFYFDEHEGWLREQNVTLELEFERIPIIAVPRDHLMVVINNIVHNAVEAMPEGGKLSVSLTRHDADSVRLSIRDSGPGIAPQHMEKLFEPFFTTKADGCSRQAGMGLAVAYGLVQEMRGVLTASSDLGRGARFDVRLPIRPTGSFTPPCT